MKPRYQALAAAFLLPFAIPGVAVTEEGPPQWSPANSLGSLVQQATRQYRDHENALAMGYFPLECVSGGGGGAMGVHFVNEQFLLDGLPPDVNQPEALLYEPMPNGEYRLVGVEYLTFEGPAVLEGQLLNYHGSPNRYGLPAFYELHVWAWKENPNGTFADWHPNVSCDAFVPPPA